MQDMMIQVTFIDWREDGDRNYLRTGELVNPFSIDELGVSVETDNDEIDVLFRRSNGDEHIARIHQVRVDSMVPVVRRNGQWVVA